MRLPPHCLGISLTYTIHSVFSTSCKYIIDLKNTPKKRLNTSLDFCSFLVIYISNKFWMTGCIWRQSQSGRFRFSLHKNTICYTPPRHDFHTAALVSANKEKQHLSPLFCLPLPLLCFSLCVYGGGLLGSANGNASCVAPHSSPSPFTKVTESFTRQTASPILT